MKERELREVATCIQCGEKIGACGSPFFYRLTIERYGVKVDSIRRQTGLAQFKVICVVDLVLVVPVTHLCALTQQETTFGDYSPTRFAWRLENLRVLVEPIPVRGRQGLWEWPVELESLAFKMVHS